MHTDIPPHEKRHLVSETLTEILKSRLEDTSSLPSGKLGKISLLPAPTGSGKSYAVAKVMGEKSLQESNPPMIYMVHTVHNLAEAYRDFCRITPEAKEKGLLLKNDAEMLLEYFSRVIDKEENEIERIVHFDEYKSLKQAVYFVLNAKRNDASSSLQLENAYELINTTKNTLRQKLSAEYKRLSQSQKEAFKLAVAPLFPTVNLETYRAVFLTAKKFLYPVWTLSGYTYIYDMDMFKNGVLFIDEFDAQKNVFLNHFTEEAAKYATNKLHFFRNASHSIKEARFLKKYGIDEEHAESVSNTLQTVYQTYACRYNFVFIPQPDETERYIIRSDTAGSFENTKRGKLSLRCDPNRETNFIANGKAHTFSQLIGDIDTAIRMLAGLGKRVVGIERDKWYKKRESGEAAWVDWVKVTEDILHQFIGEFDLSSQDANYRFFKNIILNRMEEKHYAILPSPSEEFYTNGLSLVHMENKNEDTKRSDFEFYSLMQTPEHFLIRVASRMHIIGISATAGLETVIKNFDLPYLKEKLLIEQLSASQTEEIERLYIQENGLEEKQTFIEFIAPELQEEWFAHDPLILRQVTRILESFDTTFARERIIKLLSLYWRFITNEAIQSFLVLRNAYLTNEEKEALHDLLSLMLFANRSNPLVKPEAKNRTQSAEHNTSVSLFYTIETKKGGIRNYKKEVVDPLLAQGKSVFVIGVYSALGAGVNLHYTLNGQEKDYDAIYCERPYNLLIRNPGNAPVQNRLKLMYQIHALYVSMSIDKHTFHRYLNRALSSEEKEWSAIAYNQGYDYVNAAMIVLIQAIGRLHRVNNAHDAMFVFLDQDIQPIMRDFDAHGHTLLPSVRKILNESRNKAAHTFQAGDFCRKTERKSAYMARKIEHLIGSFHSDHHKRKYRELRIHLLRNPTAATLESEYQGLYTPLLERKEKRYWYKVEQGDYTEVSCRLVKSQGYIEVSEEAAHLPILAKLPDLKAYFDKHGYALSFQYNHLPVPVVFNNLYKGILGETVGKFIFETYYGITLNEIDEKDNFYEFFDFITPNRVAVDFKYYSRRRLEETTEEELRKKAIKKRKEMGLDKVLIINILYTGGTERVNREIRLEDGVAVVPFLIDATNENDPKIDSRIAQQIMEFIL